MICVTGAAGFIGSHLVNTLSKEAAVVHCCDVDHPTMIKPHDLIEHLENNRPDAIFHLGGLSSTTATDTVAITANNILLSCALLEFSINAQVPFVYASSASVYGLGKSGFKENCFSTPLHYYGISKASFDMYVLQKIKDNPKARIFGLRYFNVYGNNEGHKGDQASPVHKFLNQARSTGQIRIFEGSHNFLRDFVHVDDVVKITKCAINFDKSGIYNVGTGSPRSFLDVANIIVAQTNAGQIIEIPFPDKLVNKYQKFTCSDNTKINSTVCSHGRICLEDGIKRVING